MTEHSSPQTPEVTGLLIAWGEGDRDALEQLTPMVDVELRRIAEAYLSREKSDHILQTTALDFAANQDTATGGDLSQYRYVHFATHGLLNNEHPELSGLVLSLVDEAGKDTDGFLQLVEIYNLKLPAELVVLSACKTGIGKEVKGEGLMSLTRGFMHAGAARVLVSLWGVNDRSTAALMSRLYQGLLREKLSPAAALRKAQLAIGQEQQWAAPYYWAAFTLHGEPR